MSLHAQQKARAAEGRPVSVGMIGACRFGSMYLTQVPRAPGMHMVAIADQSPESARANLETSVALRREVTGIATCWNAGMVARAKRALRPREVLEGEGGYTVLGKLQPAAKSLRKRGLLMGLAHDVEAVRSVVKGQCVTGTITEIDISTAAYTIRREMEDMHARAVLQESGR